jgi:phage tail sheath protein FI
MEQYRNLTLVDSALRADKVLQQSSLVRWGGSVPPGSGDISALANAQQSVQGLPPNSRSIYDDVTVAENKLTAASKKYKDDKKAGKADTILQADQQAISDATNALSQAKTTLAASDGESLTEDEFTGPGTEANKQGLYALEQADLFNLLCIPPYLATGDVDVDLVSEAAAYCEARRAMLLVDPPSDWATKDIAKSKFSDATTDYVGTRSRNAALFFPRLRQPNPLRNNQVEDYVPSGALAGVFARTDSERGVWKAPAGIDASLVGVPQLSVNLTDMENGELNQLGVNCLRAFPIYGRVVWGARTLRGADQFADEYKYIPVRRTALFIEESLYRGTKWAVFEPNDEPLWAQLRLNIGAFMHDLFRKGAFQGQTPKDAYLVKCDSETTTQNDINLGIVNVLVGFAPLKPAEFVIIQLQQIAGQIEV